MVTVIFQILLTVSFCFWFQCFSKDMFLGYLSLVWCTGVCDSWGVGRQKFLGRESIKWRTMSFVQQKLLVQLLPSELVCAWQKWMYDRAISLLLSFSFVFLPWPCQWVLFLFSFGTKGMAASALSGYCRSIFVVTHIPDKQPRGQGDVRYLLCSD